MRILIGEKCPECGGKVILRSSGISCLSCGFYRDNLPQKVIEELRAASEEVPTEIELTTPGETLLESDIHDLLDYRRLCQNHVEGYRLRDLDRMTLLKKGFARRLAVKEEQKNG